MEYEENPELDELQEQMKDLAAKSAVLSARKNVEELEEHLGPIDLRSYVIGRAAASAEGLPDFIVTKIVVEMMKCFDAHLAAEIRVEGAFDDLPVFDPGNGS